MNFKHEKYFTDAVNSGSIQEIKIAICLHINKDASDSNGDIKNAVKYLDSKGINIWQTHKEIEETKPREQWNVDYIGLLESDLMYNFSRERLNLIMEVGRHVYGRKQNVQSNVLSHRNVSYSDKEISKSSSIHNADKDRTRITDNNTDGNKNFNDAYSQKRDEMTNQHNMKRDSHNQNKSNAKSTPQGNNGGIDIEGGLKVFGKAIGKMFNGSNKKK